MPAGKRQPQGGWRTPSLRGSMMIDSTRGSLRVRSWPKKRPSPRHPTNEYWSNWLRSITLIYRYQPAAVQFQLQKATKGTIWMPRDIFISAARGRAWLLTDENGRSYFPMPFVREVSESLDAIAQLEGQMVYRSSGLWAPVPAGNDGEVLTYNATENKPEWQPKPFTGVYFVPLSITQTSLVAQNVNSTTYVTPGNWRVRFPGSAFNASQMRLRMRAQTNAAGQTVDATLANTSAPTVPLAGAPGVLQFVNALQEFDTDWVDLTTPITSDFTIALALKGSNSTVDIQFTDCYFWLR